LFAFKGVAPDTDLCTIIASTYPFIALFIIGMAIIYIFPQTATFLPAQLI
jgi:TRAP-type mannitol/chloroaromatic compound transport system permease large subunit